MDRKGIYEGQTVITLDGEKLGKVILCEHDYFIVEKGMLFPKDYAVRYEYVRGGDEGHAILSLTKEQIKNGEGEIASTFGQSGLAGAHVSDTSSSSRLTEVPASSFASGSSTASQTTDSFRNTGFNEPLSTSSNNNYVSSNTTSSSSDLLGSQQRAGAFSAQDDLSVRSRNVTATEELRVPLVEEKMDVSKREVETGEVVIHKEVITEMKTVTVPVTREEVHIERVAVSENDARAGTVAMESAAFQDATIRVPIHEEQIEVTKRPVVREEIRVSKDIVVEQQSAQAELRKEQVDIEEDSSLNLTDKRVKSTDIRSKDIRAS